MMYTATVTQKGQVTIPKKLRDLLKVKPKQRVVFEVKNNKITLDSQHNLIEELAGSLNPKPGTAPYSEKAANEAVMNYAAKQYAKKEKRSRS